MVNNLKCTLALLVAGVVCTTAFHSAPSLLSLRSSLKQTKKGVSASRCCIRTHHERNEYTSAFVSVGKPRLKPDFHSTRGQRCRMQGWLDGLFPTVDPEEQAAQEAERRLAFPELYAAIVDQYAEPLEGDDADAALVRPLLIGTQLQLRPLKLAFCASRDGWDAAAFHRGVDGLGAAVVICETEDGAVVGGYNPMGWAGMGGPRPSMAAFLFAWAPDVAARSGPAAIKLRKIGGAGLACGNDDPNAGIWFGPDGLVVDFGSGQARVARSKLGTYFERGPQGMGSLVGDGVWRGAGPVELTEVKVLAGVYGEGEEIPNSGAVFDMTSG